MDNQELLKLNLDNKLCLQRLRFMERQKFSFLVEGYREGKHVFSYMSMAYPHLRKLGLLIAGYLGSDRIITVADSYIRTSKDGSELLRDYEHGSITKAFSQGDPEVSEAITVTCLDMDSGAASGSIPYVRGYKNAHVLREKEASGVREIVGSIYDEMEYVLTNGANLKKTEELPSVKEFIDRIYPELREQANVCFVLSKDATLGDGEYVSTSNWKIVNGFEVLGDGLTSSTKNGLDSEFEKLTQICDPTR